MSPSVAEKPEVVLVTAAAGGAGGLVALLVLVGEGPDRAGVGEGLRRDARRVADVGPLRAAEVPRPGAVDAL